MAQDSKIEWTHHTANLWWGCEHVHAGCDNCYAEAWAKWKASAVTVWGSNTPRMEVKGVWKDLIKFQRLAAEANEMHRVFIGSMMDIAEKPMILIKRDGSPVGIDTSDGSLVTNEHLRQKLFREVVPMTPNLLYLFLSKRSSYYNKVVPEKWLESPPPNVMFGTSVVDQPTYDTHKRHLLRVKGRRFLSVEPQIGPINAPDLSGIDWVICGGESGPKRRPFNPDWARALRDQCARQNVAFFMKQIDKVQSIPDDLLIRQFPVLN